MGAHNQLQTWLERGFSFYPSMTRFLNLFLPSIRQVGVLRHDRFVLPQGWTGQEEPINVNSIIDN